MKHAILITAYKNFDHLYHLISFFDEDFEIHIHFDKKTLITKEEIEKLRKVKTVKTVITSYDILWGGINHLKAIIQLCEIAVKSNVGYIHLLTGACYPIKKLPYIKEFFINNNGKEYMEHFSLPFDNWSGGGYNRIIYFQLYDYLNAKNIFFMNLLRHMENFQRKFGIKRSVKKLPKKLFGGSTYWSLTGSCVKYILDYTNKNKSVLKRFRYTFCSEEMFFPTVIMNSPFAKNVIDDNLRTIEFWNRRNGNCPSNLDETDFDQLMKTRNLFARKFEYPVSEKLFNKIKEVVG